VLGLSNAWAMKPSTNRRAQLPSSSNLPQPLVDTHASHTLNVANSMGAWVRNGWGFASRAHGVLAGWRVVDLQKYSLLPLWMFLLPSRRNFFSTPITILLSPSFPPTYPFSVCLFSDWSVDSGFLIAFFFRAGCNSYPSSFFFLLRFAPQFVRFAVS
jgi:hypothetical protein